MPAVVYNIALEQGATYDAVFEWREDDGSDPPTGPLVDTTGYTAAMQLRTGPGGELLLELGPDNGLTVAGGILTLRIGADLTGALTQGGRYDLELHADTDPTDVQRLLQGAVTLDPQISTDTP